MNIKHLIDKIDSTSKKYPSTTFNSTGKIYTCINPFKYHILRKNYDTYMDMDGLFVDGILMCKFIKIFWSKSIKRLSFDMTSMAKDLFEKINDNGASIYFIGDEQEMIKLAVKKIKESYPNMNIIGFHSGFFENETDKHNIIKEIVNLNPLYAIIGMGGLFQEQFALSLKKNGFRGIAFTCGGYFHQAAGKLSYYPAWVNRYNLRAAYRIIKEKNYKRLWHVLVTFPMLFIIDTIKAKSSNKNIHSYEQ